VATLLRRGLSEGPQRPAIICDGEFLSYEELCRCSTIVAWHLARLGLVAGHRLALIVPPGPRLLPLVLGALHRGLLVSILSVSLGPQARAFRLAQLRPDLVLDDEDQLFHLPELPTVSAPRTPGPGLLLWTADSTNQPRGVVLTPEALLWNVQANAAALGLQPTDRTLVVDAADGHALIHQLFGHLLVGAAVVLLLER
jgi:acyl-CoA synthetase (AMP-forming)/AMP-acid ligase II